MKKHILLSILLAIVLPAAAFCQQTSRNAVSFDKLSHNFGDVMLDSGPLTCTFTMKNASDSPVAIFSVVASCGCTDVEWTHEPVAPGKCGTIKATYSNDEGAYPFEKSLTVYISSQKTPVILKFKGVSHAKKVPLAESYPLHLGDFALKTPDIKVGNLEQGNSKSDEISVANLSKTPLKVEFNDIDPDLKVRVEPNPIPAGGTANMLVSIESNRSRWGKNHYYCTPVVNGKSYGRIGFWAITKENFDNWPEEKIASAAKPLMKSSTYDYGNIRAGRIVETEFTVSNTGKSDLVLYRADSEDKGISTSHPQSIKPGARAQIKVRWDSTGYGHGEHQISICLYTNSPARPLLYLFLSGNVE